MIFIDEIEPPSANTKKVTVYFPAIAVLIITDLQNSEVGLELIQLGRETAGELKVAWYFVISQF